jgi:exonuclease III
VDDDNPELSMMARRGYGGIAILWKKEIDDKIQMLNEGNNRVQVIQIDTECRPVCLINIYMPSDSKEHNYEYNDMLSQLAEILNKFRETHDIVLCGDLNGSLHREKTLHDGLLQKFLKEHRVKIEPSYPEKSTFYPHNGKSEGQIDYIISIGKSIMSVNILDMENTNKSDHVPRIANMECHLLRRKEKPKLLNANIKWNK